MDISKESLKMHYEKQGKIEIVSRVPVADQKDLSLAYTPGVAAPCLAIAEDSDLSYSLTRRANLVAVITDGTAVLGLGDIGPLAAMPVMEGKCVLFKEFGGVDAIPLCLKTKDAGEIVDIIAALSGSFGGINLEDISAPRCFEIEEKLKRRCDIPVFHDDQHGTAVVVCAAVMNSLRLLKRNFSQAKVVISGAGAAGIAIAQLLLDLDIESLILCDSSGIIHDGRADLNSAKRAIAKVTNKHNTKGTLKDALKGANIFIGVSGPGTVAPDMIKEMEKDPIVFALANPTPEIMPQEAKDAGAKIVGTGRSDFENQINNVLAFPGIFRGALNVRASEINGAMKYAAAKAIASLISDEELSPSYIIPKAFDKRVGSAVADAVSNAAFETGVARI